LKAKTKNLRGRGSMSTSNVNSQSECITLTYAVKNIKAPKDIAILEKEISDLIEEEIIFDLEIKDHSSDQEEIVLKAKVKTCNDEARGHEIKEIFDKFIKKKGGQTTLDESRGEES
jgi:sRNA-binding carbon storage regulator CsrA